MKKLFYVLLCPIVLSLASCNIADDKDYENMAADFCGCVNKNTTGVSDGMKKAIEKAVNDGKDLETAMTEHMSKDLTQGMKDAQAMTQLQVGIESCMNDLEKKYKNVYSSDTEEEVQNKLIKTLEASKDCGFTYAIFKLGQQEMAKGK